MTNEETILKLTEMRLTAMAGAFQISERLKNPAMASLSFEDRLGLLTDIEWASRKNNRLKKLDSPRQGVPSRRPGSTSLRPISPMSTIRPDASWIKRRLPPCRPAGTLKSRQPAAA